MAKLVNYTCKSFIKLVSEDHRFRLWVLVNYQYL